MIIGVKFCGGCNPKYDRGKLYERIREVYSEHSFETAGEEKIYDMLLVITGCERACPDITRYKAERTVKVSQDMVPEI